MKHTPTSIATYFYCDDPAYKTFQSILETSDSVIALLTPEQFTEWLVVFHTIASADDAPDFADFGTATLAFDLTQDGDLFVLVSDAGGEVATGEFQEYCEKRDIPFQFIIDSPDVTGVALDEIYTGTDENNTKLLTLLHALYND